MGLVKSASRVFEILECFGKERRPLRLRDFVGHLRHPTSSIAAILKSMTEQGYLIFDADSLSYLPSPRLALLVNWIPSESFEQGIVLDSMRSLQQFTNETVVLAAVKGIYLEYVETLRSTEGLQLNIPPGTRRLLIQTGTGWQFLSRWNESEALDVYRQTISLGQLTEAEFPPEKFREKLREQREHDICFVRARELLRPVAHWGGGMVSILIPVPAGHRPLAIGIGGPAERLEEKIDGISSALRAESARIQSVIGVVCDREH